MDRFLWRNTIALAMVFALSGYTPPVHAQEDSGATEGIGTRALKNLTLEELSKISITSVSKESTEAFKTPAAISVMTRQDIARSGATTFPDLLRLVPGVEVAQISSDKWAIGIRGFEGYLSKSVLVLIDGRSVYTPLFAGVYWEMQDTLIEDIERIEVIRGPGGTIWGANAINGVINIITRNAHDTPGTRITAAGGNVEQGNVSVRYGREDNNVAYRVWSKAFTRSPQYHSDGRNFDDWRRVQAGFRLDWDPDVRNNLTISGDAYGTRAGNKVAISTYSPPEIFNLEKNADLSGQNLVFGWRRSFSSGSDIQVRGYFDRTDRKDLNYREVRQTFDLDFVHHVPVGAHDVIWGIGARISPSHFFQTSPTVEFFPPKTRDSIYSGFLQDSISLGSQVTAIVGAKVEHNSYSGFEVQPSARVSWTPTSQQTLWAAVTRAVRTPSRLEEGFRFSFLAAPAVPLYLRLVGDSEFDAERLVGYEAGFRTYITQHAVVGVNAFYNRYDKLLSVENRPPVLEETPEPAHQVLALLLRNGIAAETMGTEATGLVDIREGWRMRSSYSFLQLNASRHAGSNDASTERQLEGDTPQHKVVVTSIFTLPREINLDLTYRYVSSIPNQRIPAYSTGDIRLAKRITRDLELSLVGRNLFQPHHPEYGGVPGPLVEIRRSAYLKLEWSR